MMEKRKATYIEPSEYIPKELRKEFGLGEYSELYKKRLEEKKTVNKTAKKTTKKSK